MHSETQAPFDAVAKSYDREFTHRPIGRMQRERVWNFLKKDLSGKGFQEILEINCGTGVDAGWLAEKGHAVTATDVSPEMVRMAKGKGLGKVTFEVCPFEAVANRYEHKKFDLIFSNFAGLNCAGPECHKKLSADFSKILKPGGLFVSVLLGKKCLVEKLYFLAKGRFSEMNRRNNTATAVLAPGQFQETWYYTAMEFQTLYSDFDLAVKKPVGLFLPPSYIGPLLNDNPTLLSMVNWCERSLGNLSFLADYADHAYLVLQKKPDAVL